MHAENLLLAHPIVLIDLTAVVTKRERLIFWKHFYLPGCERITKRTHLSTVSSVFMLQLPSLPQSANYWSALLFSDWPQEREGQSRRKHVHALRQRAGHWESRGKKPEQTLGWKSELVHCFSFLSMFNYLISLKCFLEDSKRMDAERWACFLHLDLHLHLLDLFSLCCFGIKRCIVPKDTAFLFILSATQLCIQSCARL